MGDRPENVYFSCLTTSMELSLGVRSSKIISLTAIYMWKVTYSTHVMDAEGNITFTVNSN